MQKLNEKYKILKQDIEKYKNLITPYISEVYVFISVIYFSICRLSGVKTSYNNDIETYNTDIEDISSYKSYKKDIENEKISPENVQENEEISLKEKPEKKEIDEWIYIETGMKKFKDKSTNQEYIKRYYHRYCDYIHCGKIYYCFKKNGRFCSNKCRLDNHRLKKINS